MRLTRYLVILAALALAGAAGAAGPAAEETTQQRIDRLERELKELKTDTQKLDATNKQLRTDTRKLEVANEEAAKLKPIAGWDKGFFLQSPDGANKMTVGGYVHFDGRYFINGSNSGVSQFLLRRARLDLRGKFLKYYEFRFMPDFAGGQVVIQDAYLNVNYVPYARIQAGKYKTPFGIERLQSANALVFIERGLPNNLVPNRDLGFMLWGVPFYGAMEYELALLNGTADGGSNNGDVGFGDDKTFAGRLFFQPLKDGQWEWARGLGAGIAGTIGIRKGSLSTPGLPQYKTDGQQNFFTYVTNSPPTAAGTAYANGYQWRISPQATYYWGPFGFLGEWVQSNNDITLNNNTANIRANSWQTQISWVLTGEDNSYKPIVPAHNFDPWTFLDGNWGALQIAFRYAALSVENKVYTLGFADRNKAAREADSWALALNWSLNPMVRLMLDYDQSTFTGGAKNGGDRPDEDVIMSRVQFVF
ncbi:porin [bacterium]|nr:porin [bacterium]